MTNEQLIAEIDELLRLAPDQSTFRNHTDENAVWYGRVTAVLEKWNEYKSVILQKYINQIRNVQARENQEGYFMLRTLLFQAKSDLQMKSEAPTSAVIQTGKVYEYFNEVNKIIESARQDILFVDPYLDSKFVEQYLQNVVSGVSVRLLTRKKLKSLIPAVSALKEQNATAINVRSADAFHDRYVFIDKVVCYQSGASFKEGGKTAPTTLTQIIDAFEPVLKTYETLWSTAKLEFPLA